jgi:hypothetical protein
MERTMHEQIDDPIRRFQHDLQKQHDDAEQLRPLLRACQDAIERAASQAAATISCEGLRVQICLMLFADTLDDAVVLMRELAKEGIRSRDKKFRDANLFDVIGMRVYELTRDVQLMVMLSGDRCKMVQVGTKEVPVYDIKCGEEVSSTVNPSASVPAL